jgi:RNA polymerase sigma-70 factor, ECF subfamily
VHGNRVEDSHQISGPASSDADLLLQVQQGSGAAFAVLIRRNNRRLFRLARSILKDDAEAEEAVQEGYLRAFAHANDFRQEASVGTWLARIVINEALGRLRRRPVTAELTEAAAGLPTGTDASMPNSESSAARGEIRRLIEAAVDALPAPFRSAFILRAVEQLSVAETAV